MAACLCYNYPNDIKAVEMQEIIQKSGINGILKNISRITDERIVEKIQKDYERIKNEGSGLKKS